MLDVYLLVFMTGLGIDCAGVKYGVEKGVFTPGVGREGLTGLAGVFATGV